MNVYGSNRILDLTKKLIIKSNNIEDATYTLNICQQESN